MDSATHHALFSASYNHKKLYGRLFQQLNQRQNIFKKRMQKSCTDS